MSDNTVQEFIDRLNSEKRVQKEIDFTENLTEQELGWFSGQGFEEIGSEIDVEQHRHYETSITVYKSKSGFLLGVRKISNVYSEMSDVEDCYHYIELYEMQEVEVISYTIKDQASKL